MNRKMNRTWIPVLAAILVLVGVIVRKERTPQYSGNVMNVPAFSGEPYVVVNSNDPEFSQEDLTVDAYEAYSSLDALGRCGFALACLGEELMPDEERQSISSVKPSGWVQAEYDFVDGKNLYNRCHLIGFQLSGENANERNLITGTRYMNVEGMLPFENMVADYIKETGNHVLYRVTPVFHGYELVARGVQLEARSVEDSGDGICFNVYVYNNQPGVEIDYATGNSVQSGVLQEEETNSTEGKYIINTNSRKFHHEFCSQGQAISEDNKMVSGDSREVLIKNGYQPAGCCEP